jgi:hypothetical protein
MPRCWAASYRAPGCRDTDTGSPGVDFRRDSAMANGAFYRAAAPAVGCGARVGEGRSRFSPKNSKIGEAMKIDEDVPITIPKMGSMRKPRAATHARDGRPTAMYSRDSNVDYGPSLRVVRRFCGIVLFFACWAAVRHWPYPIIHLSYMLKVAFGVCSIRVAPE